MRLSDSLLVQPLDDGDVVIRDESSDNEVVISAGLIDACCIALRDVAAASEYGARNEALKVESEALGWRGEL